MATRIAGRTRGASRKKRPAWVKHAKRVACFGLLAFFIGGSAGGFFIITAMKKASERIKNLPDLLAEVSNKPPTIVYAADRKTVLYRAAPVYRKAIATYDEIPERIIHATLAAEDKRFFSHDGVDYWAAGRSIVTNIREQRSAQGGSTITMQLCKRLYTSSQKTWQRKLDDVCMAIQMERMLTKQEILRQYLNEVFYGQGAYGIKAAAQVYFGKGLDQLTNSEAATLARLVRRPSDENPFVDKDAALYNRDVVLLVMRDEKWITDAEYEHGKKEKLALKEASFAGGDKVVAYPYFTHYVLDYLKENLPEIDIRQGGYKVYTTLDPALQDIAAAAVAKTVKDYRRNGVKTGAFLLMDNTGRILAMQGGLDYKRNQFNATYQGLGRQPGSSMKPFIYAAALSVGAISPGDRISNEPFEMPDGNGKVWRPQNSGGGFGGSYSIGSALAQSKNVPAVWVTSKVGPSVAVKYCRDVFGFTTKLDPVMSMALGTNDVRPIELASAYTVFMTGGDRVEPRPVVKIEGPNGETVKNYKPLIYQHQLDAGVSHLMDEYLRGVVTGGTATAAQVVSDSRGKTGTTQDNKDAWFCGYTNNLIGIAWIANENFDAKRKRWVYTPMSSRTFGGTVAIQIWKPVMKAAQKKFGRGEKIEGDALGRDIGVTVTNREREQDENVDETPVKTREPEQEETPPAKQEDIPPTREPERTIPETTRPPRTEERERPRTENEVSVEVCASSGLKATIYCPETNTRSFAAGNAPKRWCRTHSQ